MAKESKQVEALAAALRGKSDPAVQFRDFYVATSPRLLAFLTRETLDADLAADLLAESYALALEKRSRFRGHTDREATAWIFTIARRVHLEYRRKGRVASNAIGRLKIDVPRLTDEDRVRVERMADLPAIREGLRSVLADLPQQQGQALTLRIVNEYSYSEIANALRISEQAARKAVSRALSTMRSAAGELEEYA
jgi:RNA polymerase sigma-70 factor (ECF subfamily)